MELLVMHSVKDGEQNQSSSSSDGKEERTDGAEFVEAALVLDQLSTVSQPPLRQEGEIEEYHRDSTSGNKERFQARGTDIRDIAAKRSC